MKVMVTGGTGFVGSHTVSELIRNGHQVRLLVRSKDRVEPALQPLGVQDVDVVQGDVLDGESVERAAEGCDATVHCGSVYSLDARKAETIKRTNVAGTEIVLGTAHRLGHDPIIHVSSFVALIGTKGAVITPDSEPTQPPGTYFRSKADSDQVARKFQQAGAPVVITYPGSVWGPHDPHYGESCLLARNILRGGWRMTVKGLLPLSDVRDIAGLHAVLMKKGQGPRRYLAPMQNVTLKEILSTVSDITGRKLGTVAFPGRPILSFTKGLDFLQRFLPSRLSLNYQSVYSVTCNHYADDLSTRNDFGIEPRPLAETLEDTIRWLVQQGFIPSSLTGTLFSR